MSPTAQFEKPHLDFESVSDVPGLNCQRCSRSGPVTDPAQVRDLTGFVSTPTVSYQISVPHTLLNTNLDSSTIDLFNLPALSTVAAFDFNGGDQEFIAVPTLHICDVDGNGVIDRNDIARILSARNTPAAPGDPRDADGDGVITVNDARICTIVCFNTGCAVP